MENINRSASPNTTKLNAAGGKQVMMNNGNAIPNNDILAKPKSNLSPVFEPISRSAPSTPSPEIRFQTSSPTLQNQIAKNMMVRKLQEESIKYMGTPPSNATRRASYAVTQTQTPYFKSNGSTGLQSIDENRNGSPSHSSNSEESSGPVFQYFGGRSHGQRSFSFSVGQQNPDEFLQPPPGMEDFVFQRRASGTNLPGFDDEEERNGAYGRRPSFSQEEYMMMDRMHQMQLEDWPPQPVMPLQSHQQPLMDPSQRQELLHRRVSTFSNSFKQPNGHDQQTNIYMPATSNSMLNVQNNAGLPRRFSFAPGFVPPYDSKDIATRYFTNDPNLLENRRHSITAAMNQNNEGQEQALDKMSQPLPNDFAEQYGNLLDPVHNAADETRNRSWSEPKQATHHGTETKPANTSKQLPLYIVEFKGGRNDFFYVPEGSNLKVKTGDLVIVEADRGKDLGKIVLGNITSPDQLSNYPLNNGTGGVGLSAEEIFQMLHKSLHPKCIYRHAQPAEVHMLLDKARDETKSLSIVKAKAKQKSLPMEIVDAEYQWDRKKLTFYFVAEHRIDFRELVKDLFKIYKTRIWMCAVERGHTGLKFVKPS